MLTKEEYRNKLQSDWFDLDLADAMDESVQGSHLTSDEVKHRKAERHQQRQLLFKQALALV